jgi:hypothetical protein
MLDSTNYQSFLITDSTGNTTEIPLSQLNGVKCVYNSFDIIYLDGTTVISYTNIESTSRGNDFFTITDSTGGVTYILMTHVERVQPTSIIFTATYTNDSTSVFYCMDQKDADIRDNSGTLLSVSNPYLRIISMDPAPITIIKTLSGNTYEILSYKIKNMTTS